MRRQLLRFTHSLNVCKVAFAIWPSQGFIRFLKISRVSADLTLNRPGGGGIRPQAGSSLCCAETVSSRKLKLCGFYYILIGLNSDFRFAIM